MHPLRTTATAWLADGVATVVVEVTETRGSVPRGAGTRMLVSASRTAGTVGGGHLEWQAIAAARQLLDAGDRGNGAPPQRLHFPLGPALGQCCGGAVTLSLAPLDAAGIAAWPAPPPRFRLQLHGAGHVGRAIAQALAPLPVEVDWIDGRDAGFPEHEPAAEATAATIRRIATDTPEAEVDLAAPGAFFLVLTHRHDLDLRIAEAVLRRADFGWFGLIGSRTKKQRFVHRFEQRGLPAAVVDRMTCPIGVPGIDGKEPEVIAAAVVAQLLQASNGGIG